ncbi:MAG: two pore domain potassium channel family protein [Desulfobacterales bacterium]|nr:MAG: two pore domain potassium channel family protein [Desulfobacterales bacterium]
MEADRIRLRLYLCVFTALLLVGSFGFMFIENLSLVDSIYFAIVTMATVGYGDIHPQSNAGKILALILIVGGVGTFLGVVASITEIFLKRREESFRREKLNMVTGLFFSEMGSGLLRQFARIDPQIDILYQNLKVSNDWTNKDFHRANISLKEHRFSVDSRRGDLSALREYLQNRANLLLRLLENPILQEHGNFADLLRAIFHLRDELLNRTDLTELLDTDRKHLEGDIARVYKLLVFAWLAYMRYLKNNYGYLLSLAMRVNPFDPEASAVVRSS